MTQTLGRVDFAGAQSRQDGEMRVYGLQGTVTIRRDAFGVPHIQADSEWDVWFGQGFAAAQDRLWQMEYDRRRAAGRWAEAVGPSGVAADRQARRLCLVEASKADVEAMSPETRRMFDAYTAGVNAFLSSGEPLPVEYTLTGLTPEPWEPWHSVAAFKVRHVLMGVWQQKICQARLLAMIGPEAFERLDRRPPIGSVLLLPPGSSVANLFATAAEDIAAAAEQLGFLAEVEAGSNSWAVHGSRVSTGKPVLCNDSHRALDVPSVYWQVHLSCPEFNASGATFPGMPGLPHFGHNGDVAWNITHGSGDYQDLYIERFEGGRCLTPEGWVAAEQRTEEIAVRGGEPVTVEVWRTRHGPVVHGDPRTGQALSLRYTATDRPCRAWETLRPMLLASTVEELFETQRGWVDPVNNLVAADTSGNIGYLTRGELPVRSSHAHRQFPAPGWTGEHEWVGTVPFEQLPRAINPPEGFIATANQKIIDSEEPFIGHTFAPPSRAERIVELLTASDQMTPEQIAAMQGDVLSRPARTWSTLVSSVGPFSGDAERARQMLAGWNGDLRPESNKALLYAYFKRDLARALYEPIVGAKAWAWLTSGEQPALGRMISQWLAVSVTALDGGGDEARSAPDGRPWAEVLPAPLASAWQAATAAAGVDPSSWRWDAVHGTNAKHTLTGAFPDLASALNPPRAMVGGDSDTLQCSGYEIRPVSHFDISNLSVYRQVVDFNDPEHGSFVIPGGASGLPGTEHASDQLEHWRTHQRIPMWLNDADVEAAATHSLTLRPR